MAGHVQGHGRAYICSLRTASLCVSSLVWPLQHIQRAPSIPTPPRAIYKPSPRISSYMKGHTFMKSSTGCCASSHLMRPATSMPPAPAATALAGAPFAAAPAGVQQQRRQQQPHKQRLRRPQLQPMRRLVRKLLEQTLRIQLQGRMCGMWCV